MSNVDRILGEVWDGLKDNRGLVMWFGLAVAGFWLLQQTIRGGVKAFWTLFGLGMAFYWSGAPFVLEALF